MNKSESWVTIYEVAEHLGVHHMTIRRWISHQGMPAYKLGNVYRLKMSDVDAWVKSVHNASCEGGSAVR